jgi:hypothetical protein
MTISSETIWPAAAVMPILLQKCSNNTVFGTFRETATRALLRTAVKFAGKNEVSDNWYGCKLVAARKTDSRKYFRRTDLMPSICRKATTSGNNVAATVHWF